jgi:hypothetical protein
VWQKQLRLMVVDPGEVRVDEHAHAVVDLLLADPLLGFFHDLADMPDRFGVGHAVLLHRPAGLGCLRAVLFVGHTAEPRPRA